MSGGSDKRVVVCKLWTATRVTTSAASNKNNNNNKIASTREKSSNTDDKLEAREVACLEGHHERITSVAITLDGQRIVSGGDDNNIFVWE